MTLPRKTQKREEYRGIANNSGLIEKKEKFDLHYNIVLLIIYTTGELSWQKKIGGEKMKTTLKTLLALMLCFALILSMGVIASAETYTPGTYSASSMGRNAPLTVECVFTEDAIESIEVTAHSETAGIGSVAVDQLPQMIVEAQSLGVDGISGATLTSFAIKNAVRQCVEAAGGDAKALAAVPVEKENTDPIEETADVIIVGAGGAGMSAAVAFVLTLATIVTYLVQKFVLDQFGLQYLQTIAFILVIASLVQMVEIILKKVSPALYQALGIFLPLITTNCAVLGVAILVIQKDFDLVQSIVYAFSTAIGFGLALTVFAGMREQMELSDIPKGMRGTAIVLVAAGLLSLAFMGFSGVDGGLKVLFGL